MKPSEFKKATKTVGSEKMLTAMLVQIANVWDALLLNGFSEHISAGGTIQNFFTDEKTRYDTEDSPIYLEVKRRVFGNKSYQVTLGICLGGLCGEGAEFEFSRNGELIGNGPTSTWIH